MPSGPQVDRGQPLHPRVLIVDRSDDVREVLSTVLKRRGVETFEACDARAGLDLAREVQPQVIVLDLEADDATDSDVRSGYSDEVDQQHGYLVLLGNVRGHQTPRAATVSKPYHYGPLIRTIEELVARSPDEADDVSTAPL